MVETEGSEVVGGKEGGKVQGGETNRVVSGQLVQLAHLLVIT